MLADFDRWRGFQAAHIFPLAYQAKWDEYNYDSVITIPPANEPHRCVNSVQNGILIAGCMHDFFDAYEVTINPDV